MKKYDLVELKDNIKELSVKNILKSAKGIVIDKQANICHVMFLNEHNQGEYAFAEVDEKHLKFLYKFPDNELAQLKQFINKTDINNFQKFSLSEVKEYDLVELIADKKHYNKEGVFKGMFGAVMSSGPTNGKWQVIFGEFYTGKDIADIMVNEEDLKVHNFMPEDRYPKK